MKKWIGLVPKYKVGDPEKSCMTDYILVGHTYAQRIVEAGCMPMGLVPVNGWLTEDALDACEGFLVQGGQAFYPYHFQVIHHAITHHKKYLGICLGEQLIYAYFELKRRVEEQGYEGDLVKAICDYYYNQMQGVSLLERVSGHYADLPARGQEDAAKHDVNVIPGTLLHRVLGRDTMRLCTFHEKSVPIHQTLLSVNAWPASGDNAVEGVEYGDNILGVQGHPEADDLLPELFKFLADERKTNIVLE